MPDLEHLVLWDFGTACLAALFLGSSKSGFGGMAIIGILLMTRIIPARESTGVILPMLIMADFMAVAVFSRFAVWRHLIRLLIPTFLGVVGGWLLMPHIPGEFFRMAIGWTIIGLLALAIIQKCTPRLQEVAAGHPAFAWSLGLLAGVATMIANAAGSAVTVYLLACRLPKYEFVGTAAWFFLITNLSKVPFSVSMGLITAETLRFNLVLAPSVIAGVFLGKLVLKKINQRVFEWVLIGLSLAGSLRMILPS